MGINLLAVFIAAIVAFALGALWYSVLFVKPWIALLDKKEKDMGDKRSFGRMLAISFVLEFIMALALAMFIGTDSDWLFGLLVGLIGGIGWVAMALGVNYLFEGRPFKLFLINAGYAMVTSALMGAVIGAF